MIGAGAGIRTRDEALATLHFTPKLHTHKNDFMEKLERYK